MEYMVYNKVFQVVMRFSIYESVIWNEKFAEASECEFYTPLDFSILSNLQYGYYIWSPESERTMIIETINIITTADKGVRILIKGPSLERILDRRVIWEQTHIKGKLQDGLKKIFDDNIISPKLPSRKIPNFVFKYSDNAYINSIEIDKQYTGINIYDIVVDICKLYDIGFKITLSDNNEFVFELYDGSDRSYSQLLNPYILFSPKRNNLMDGRYTESYDDYKSVALVAGEGEGQSRKMLEVYLTDEESKFIGLDRRELFVDARDIRSDDTNAPAGWDYNRRLLEVGKEDLKHYRAIRVYDGKIETTRNLEYMVDFSLGDIVQLEDEYGHESRCRITEYIRSHNENGYHQYPTFSAID